MRKSLKSSDSILAEVKQLAIKRGLIAAEPLWPEEFRNGSADLPFRFLTECCWTYNEANRAIERIVPHDYVRIVCEEWARTRATGRPLIIEKSRRLIMSWVLRGCELWSMGLASEKRVIAGINYPKAAEHVWRIWWLYNQLAEHRPDWNLAKAITRGGNVAAQQVDQVILPNGSIIDTLNQEGTSFQGSGYAGVTMEEFSLYKQPEYMYGQALAVTQGKPGEPGGHVVIITNASNNKAWQGIKAH